MKVFILIHKKHGHIVAVYSNKENCVKAQEYLNKNLTKQPYEIIEKNIIWKINIQ